MSHADDTNEILRERAGNQWTSDSWCPRFPRATLMLSEKLRRPKDENAIVDAGRFTRNLIKNNLRNLDVVSESESFARSKGLEKVL